MGVTRRGFLLGTTTLTTLTALGLAAAAGCVSRVGGAPRSDPSAKLTTTTSIPPAPRKVTLAVLPYQPYTITQGGSPKGPVPDVARAVLKKIGVSEVTIEVVSEQQALLAKMAAGGIDIAGGLFVLPQYCHGVSFSIPDIVALSALLVPAGNPKGLTTLADVAANKAKLGVLAGALDMKDAQAAGVRTIEAFPTPTVLLEAVKEHRVDCAVFDDVSLRNLVPNSGSGMEVTAPFRVRNRQPYVAAYAFPPTSTQLIDPFNQALRELHESGEWLTMVKPYGLIAANDPPADVTTEKACAG